MKYAKLILFIILAAGAYYFIPVPSRSTPNATMSLNTKVNSLSLRLSELGFKGCTLSESSKCQIQGDNLIVVRNEKMGSPERLTYKVDNIFALGVKVFMIVTLYTLIFCSFGANNDWKRSLKLLGTCAGLFVALLLVRALIFGIIIRFTSVNLITFLDNPIRFLLIVVIAWPCLCLRKGKEEVKQ
jgi:hypothetical protein